MKVELRLLLTPESDTERALLDAARTEEPKVVWVDHDPWYRDSEVNFEFHLKRVGKDKEEPRREMEA